MIENQGKQKHFEQSTEPKNKQNHNTKKIIEKKRRQMYREKKRCGVCTYSYNIYKWFNNGHYGSVHTFPALRV